jgi:RNA polymerase sigma-70 factor (TIGR02943 family)
MDKTGIKELVEKHTDEMLSWAYHKTSSPEVAEDLVQETFLAALESVEKFRGDSSSKTWLFAILNNKINDHYRKKVYQPALIETTSFADFFGETEGWQKNKKPGKWHEEENLLDNDEFQKVLQYCLDALPDNWNICVKLKYLSGKKGEEICQEIGITPTNFWQIIHRAKLQLRDCVDGKWFKN